MAGLSTSGGSLGEEVPIRVTSSSLDPGVPLGPPSRSRSSWVEVQRTDGEGRGTCPLNGRGSESTNRQFTPVGVLRGVSYHSRLLVYGEGPGSDRDGPSETPSTDPRV